MVLGRIRSVWNDCARRSAIHLSSRLSTKLGCGYRSGVYDRFGTTSYQKIKQSHTTSFGGLESLLRREIWPNQKLNGFQNGIEASVGKSLPKFRLTSANAIPYDIRPLRHGSRPTFHWGPKCRPVAYPSNVAQLGLSPARQFSSERALFDNIIRNAPLSLRALVDCGHHDLKRWDGGRQLRAESSSVDYALKRGSGKKAKDSPSTRAEFESYFLPSTVEATELWDVEAGAVVVICIVDAEVGVYQLSQDLPENVGYRALSKDVPISLRDAITTVQMQSQKRVMMLFERLNDAGVFEDPTVKTQLFQSQSGFQEISITFGCRWRRRDVEDLLGDAGRSLAWWRIAEESSLKSSERVDQSFPVIAQDRMPLDFSEENVELCSWVSGVSDLSLHTHSASPASDQDSASETWRDTESSFSNPLTPENALLEAFEDPLSYPWMSLEERDDDNHSSLGDYENGIAQFLRELETVEREWRSTIER